jgi:hypothetical protein
MTKNEYQVLANLREDWDEKIQRKEYWYLFSSPLNFMVLSEIGLAQDEINFEEICQRVPKKFGSRSSILTVLNDGVMFRYLKKRISVRDRRIRCYAFTEGFRIYFCDWLEQVGNGYGRG